MDIAPVHIRRFPSLRCHCFHRVTLYRMRMQGHFDVYKWTILKRMSPEVKCLHLTSSRREMCTLSVSNVIYHKVSHGAAFYTLNGKNVNVTLELFLYRSVLCDITYTEKKVKLCFQKKIEDSCILDLSKEKYV